MKSFRNRKIEQATSVCFRSVTYQAFVTELMITVMVRLRGEAQCSKALKMVVISIKLIQVCILMFVEHNVRQIGTE